MDLNIAVENVKNNITKNYDECNHLCDFLHTVNNVKFCFLTIERLSYGVRVQQGIREEYPRVTETCEALKIFEKKSQITNN